LIGREREIAALTGLLRQSDARLVTLTGPGGIGKTRLALQAATALASDFADGVGYVALAPIGDPALLPTTIAQALGVADTSGQPPAERLADFLRARRILLLLDNFEQLLDAAPLVTQLLAAAPGLKVLVTSRAVLRLAGEHELAVPPLALPPAVGATADMMQYEAIRLFVERARAARPSFDLNDENAAAVAAICARLDGLPLAIELAAARSRLLAPPALLARLDSRLQLLTTGTRDLPERQQTLRGTIDWSYNLLRPAEQALFARLAVFVGGCTLEAAEAVCGGWGMGDGVWSKQALIPNPHPPAPILDGLATLVEQSLVRQNDGPVGEPRFTMLETIREYALERLAASGAAEALHEQHAAYYLALAERADTELVGARQADWLERVEADHDNLRAAFSWATERRRAEIALRLAGALWWFWRVRGHLSEGRKRLEAALALPDAGQAGDPSQIALRADALSGAGQLAQMQGDYTQASELYREGLELRRGLGDAAGIAEILAGQGRVALRLGDYAAAQAHFEESLKLWQEAGNQAGIADVLAGQGRVARRQGDLLAAQGHFEQSLTLYQRLNAHTSIAEAYINLGSVARLQGNYLQAKTHYQNSLELSRKLGNQRGIAMALANLGNVALEQGDYQSAKQAFEESLVIFRQLEAKTNIAVSLSNLGRVAHLLGDESQAQQFFAESLALHRELGDRRGIALVFGNMADALADQGMADEAARHYTESLTLFRALDDRAGIADTLEGLACASCARGQAERAARLFGAAEGLRATLGAPLWPVYRASYDRDVAATRAQLGELAFGAAWAAGRALTLEQAIDEAMIGDKG
jgi:predicted ATPase/Tfp pilus assembly protein PilF